MGLLVEFELTELVSIYASFPFVTSLALCYGPGAAFIHSQHVMAGLQSEMSDASKDGEYAAETMTKK